MNTADRSLAIVDYALRRRFRFCPIKPEFNEAFISFLEEKGVSLKNAELVVSKVKATNEVISTIDRGMEISHSYFCQTEGCKDFFRMVRTVCQVDELTQDVVINRFIFSTLKRLLRAEEIDEDFGFSYRYKEGGHRIFVRTVNLGQPWRKIEERVKEIVKGGRR